MQELAWSIFDKCSDSWHFYIRISVSMVTKRSVTCHWWREHNVCQWYTRSTQSSRTTSAFFSFFFFLRESSASPFCTLMPVVTWLRIISAISFVNSIRHVPGVWKHQSCFWCLEISVRLCGCMISIAITFFLNDCGIAPSNWKQSVFQICYIINVCLCTARLYQPCFYLSSPMLLFCYCVLLFRLSLFTFLWTFLSIHICFVVYLYETIISCLFV